MLEDDTFKTSKYAIKQITDLLHPSIFENASNQAHTQIQKAKIIKLRDCTLARAMTIEKKLINPIVNHSGLVNAAVLPNTKPCMHETNVIPLFSTTCQIMIYFAWLYEITYCE